MKLLPAGRSLLVLALLGVGGAACLWWPNRSYTPQDAVSEKENTVAEPTSGWKVIGRHGLELGDFNQPRGIATFPDGSFLVADRSARMQYFSAEGQPLKLWTMKEHALGNPKGLCALPNGHVLVCDTHYGRVLEMTVGGDVVAEWGGPGTEPGRFIHPLACIADAQAGVAYVVEYGNWNDRVQKFKLDGTFLKAWGTFGVEPGQLRRPSGVALDPQGHVFVADACNHRIQKFDAEGKLLHVFGSQGSEAGQLLYPYDIASAPDGTLYVAEYNNQRVSCFDANGKFLRTLGTPGKGTGEFWWPWSLTVDAQGRLLVSDTGNHRVQIIAAAEITPQKVALERKPEAAQ